ncbi:MAG: acyl-CoA dehydrogenase family protein [Acidimicrobiaceae bacterium]|nr:acyl-CoA dehydrogenase family protein [Acidimicrobiaceae bacterium]
MTATESPADTAEQTRIAEQAADALLAEHDPAEASLVEFRGHQYDAGLAWVHHPPGFGGLGLSRRMQRVVDRRLRAGGAQPADPSTFFLMLVGPTIFTHGTDEQKRRYLRPMFTGEERWCQLFSEPGSGSDFAGLGTRAERDGDEWVVNGQKVWNTLAHVADLGMLVARSNPELPKHKGLTYFALDMHAPGVEVRPLRQITGEAEFNEVYMTDVRVPDSARIGDVGEGWRVSLTTLMNERTAIGGAVGGATTAQQGPLGNLMEAYRNMDPAVRTKAHRDEVMQLWVRGEALRLTNVRAAQNARAGNPGPEGSVSKLMLAEFNKELTAKVLDLEGPAAMVDYDYEFRRPTAVSLDGKFGDTHHGFLRARANSIEGGTSEIMRNILGEQVLGLPGEPRVDKEIPWREVPRN